MVRADIEKEKNRIEMKNETKTQKTKIKAKCTNKTTREKKT